MAFSFKKYNKTSMFDFTPSYDLTDNSSYKSLKQLYDEDGEDMIYNVKAVYINTKTNFRNNATGKKEAPVFLLEDCAVNVPPHQIMEIREILEDEEAIEAINQGLCDFHIETYKTRKTDEICYKVVFD